MYMKKLLFTLSLLLVCINSAIAQNKYCLSYSNLINDEWVSAPSLSLDAKSTTDKLWTGGADFKSITSDAALDRIINHEARFVVYDGVLYVNCRPLKYQNTALGNGYAQGFLLNDNKVCFVGTKVGHSTPKKTKGSGVTFSIGGGKVETSLTDKKTVCYIIDSSSNKVQCIDRKYMKELLKNHPSLLNQYNDEGKKKQESVETIINYLNDFRKTTPY